MTIDDQIRNEKLQYHINKEAAKYQLYHLVKFISMSILLVSSMGTWRDQAKNHKTNNSNFLNYYFFSALKKLLYRALK